MKKILTLALVAAMLTATGITAYATNITQDNSDPKTGGTNVTYAVAPVYTVVIPDTVTLGNTKVTEQISIYGETADDNVVIGKTQKVNVALTASTNGFNVKNEDGETIAYTVNDKNAVDGLTTVAECAAGAKQNTDITFKKTGETKYAGTYTDTLTFTIGVEAAATQKTLTISAPADAGEDKSVTITYTTGQKWGEIDLPDGWSFNEWGYLTSGDWFIVGSGPIEAGDVIDETLNYYLYKD